ncbi:tryptophan synthase subunit alpha [Methylacidiphilum sp. Yel]|jgi:tryptophan synthase alpha chain|uniref:tryptophan synthase subunit alpha n=1 Tax=Methylacidiphilum sp. Yel TaxID=1847730 RepID=UPI00106A5EE8|nr:tryptophan synthase subunit alpha [Methylacidiphilum sp. Yel]TFE70244.1 tryptophan synthase subunit alpha [Methylacidiphilum sp. Yel]
MIGRIEKTFLELQKDRIKAFIPFVMAGDPTPEVFLNIVEILEEAGADILEVGIPFSDPLADGPIIQQSAFRALKGGMHIDRVFSLLNIIRKKSNIPIVLFSYLNPIFRYGIERFAAQAYDNGADGVLIVDLPPEESLEGINFLEKKLDRILLVTPATSPLRKKRIAERTRGFLYCVSRNGITGLQKELSKEAYELVKSMETLSKVPLCVGFGVSTPHQAKTVASYADGVVVGSALVDELARIVEGKSTLEKFKEFAFSLAKSIHQEQKDN